MHFKLSTLLSLLGFMAAVRLFEEARIVLPLVLAVMLAALVADESLQQFSETRAFDLADLYAGAFGLALGFLLFMVISGISSLQRKPS